ncbi:MAG: hypothetical protein ACNA8S_04885 [Deferrisomatales bacterium]
MSPIPSPSRTASSPAGAPPRALGAAALLAFCLAALAAGQAVSVAVTGEEVCLGEGCAIVGRLTRISPGWFNLLGAVVFTAAGALALRARRSVSPVPLALLGAVAGAALAAEGVLFAYQALVARAWCPFCLLILAGVAGLNLLLGPRAALRGAAGFAAVALIFSLLTFLPPDATLADGTLAVRPGTEPGRGADLVLLFSEDCPHCTAVVEALRANPRCTVRLNPVSELSPSYWPELRREPSHDPGVNVAAARLLGIDTIPIVIAREAGTMRVLTGEAPILRYIEEHCGEPRAPAPDPLRVPWGGGSLLGPAEDGCGLLLECD